MIYRVFPEKDTFLTTAKRSSAATPQTGSNFGASEILEVFKSVGVSGALGSASSASLARTILRFDLSDIAALTASNIAPSSGATYFLKLYDARHIGTLPTSFDVEVSMLSQSWDEGSGLDTEDFLDKGVANWDKALTSVWWSEPGGDYLSASFTASYHFDTGKEDLEVEVTDLVNDWLTGGRVNHGLMVKLTQAEEEDSSNYFKKKFHARNTHFKDKRPVLEMRWDDSVKDDRDVFLFDVSSSLYLYNKKRGQLQDISGIGIGNDVLTVTIADASGTLLVVSGSHTGVTGIYSASIYLPTGSYSGSLFTDAWSAPDGRTFMTGAFVPHNDGATSSNQQDHYVVKIMNMKKQYGLDEKARLNLFVKTRNYNPAIVQTGSLVLKNTVIEKGYYKVVNHTTGDDVIPLGTGSIETTRLSYDANGNYLNFYMSTLAQGEVYRLVFYFDVDGQLQKIDDKFLFRVV